MKVTIVKTKNKKFTPIEISITIESQEELNAMVMDGEHLHPDNCLSDLEDETINLITSIGTKLNPYRNG